MMNMCTLNNEPLVSVVIPVYNTALYLRKCLDSVVNQTYSALEIIVVNDGSTDDSRSIIQEYAERDSRIICIDKPNGGLPSARKAGVERATGKYIQHLDSDDQLDIAAIRTLVCRAEETGADIVALPFYYVYEDGTKQKAYMQQFEELSGMDYYRLIVRWKCHCNVWANFQRRSLFVEHPIEFVLDISYGEDLLLMTQLLSYARKVVMVSVPLLYYYQRSNSICNANWLKNCPDKRRHTQWIAEYLQKIGWDKRLSVEYSLLRIYAVFYCLSAGDKSEYRDDIRFVLHEMEQNPALKKSMPRRWRKLMKAYRLNFRLGDLYLRYYRKKKTRIY